MDATGTPEAQRQVERIQAFRAELDDLTGRGVVALTAEQLEQIRRYHDETLAALARDFDVDTTEAQRQVSWGLRLASTLGALALCVALVLLFYRFWGYLSEWVQVAIVTGVPPLFLAGAAWMARRERSLYYTTLLAALAFAGFVLDMLVLGALFNLAPSPRAFAVWGAFALLVAYHFGLRLMLLIGLLSLEAWIAGSLINWRGFVWWGFFERVEFLLIAAALVLFTPLVARHRRRPDFAELYRGIGLLTAFLALLFLSGSGESHWLEGWSRNHVRLFYQYTGMAATLAAIWVGVRLRMTGIVNLGALFFALFLLFRLADWLWDWMPKYLFFLLIGFIAVALVAAFKRLRAALAREAV